MAAWFLRDNATTVTGWSAVPVWSTGAKAVGALVRQLATPTANNERVWVCIVAGTSGGTEPAWTLTKGSSTTDGTVTWREVTGNAGVNNATADVPASASVRSINPGLGRIIKNDPGTHLYICNVAGTCAASVTLGTAVGGSTADGGATWICFATINAYANWSAPHAKMVTAAGNTWPVAGDDVRVADDHNEVTSTVQINASMGGSATAPINIYCITRTVVVPSPSDLRSDPYGGASPACAQVSTIGGNQMIWATGWLNVYGIVFNCGSGTATSQNIGFNCRARLERCSLRSLATGLSSIYLPPGGDVIDCTIAVNQVNSGVRPQGHYRGRWMAGTGLAVLTHTGVTPNNVMLSGVSTNYLFDGLDFSNINSTIVAAGGSAFNVQLSFVNCRFSSSVTLAATPLDTPQVVDFVACGSAASNILMQRRHRYQGTSTEFTTNYRDGGATDGVTPFCWQITTNANNRWISPFECMPIAIYNETVGSPVTVTVYGNLVGIMPLNDDVWMDVEYLGNASYPLASFATTGKATYLDTAVPNTVDTSVWQGGNQPFRMAVTITPQLRGYITIHVKIGRPSAQYYIDRRPVLS
jgi:hypothetical protein